MKKVVNSKVFKIILSIIPVFALSLITITTNYYYFFNDSYSEVYELISYFSGFSILSLPAYFYIIYKFQFCNYSKIAVWGILFYVILNIAWLLLDKFGINQNIYGYIFESSVISTHLAASLYHVTKKNKNKWII